MATTAVYTSHHHRHRIYRKQKATNLIVINPIYLTPLLAHYPQARARSHIILSSCTTYAALLLDPISPLVNSSALRCLRVRFSPSLPKPQLQKTGLPPLSLSLPHPTVHHVYIPAINIEKTACVPRYYPTAPLIRNAQREPIRRKGHLASERERNLRFLHTNTFFHLLLSLSQAPEASAEAAVAACLGSSWPRGAGARAGGGGESGDGGAQEERRERRKKEEISEPPPAEHAAAAASVSLSLSFSSVSLCVVSPYPTLTSSSDCCCCVCGCWRRESSRSGLSLRRRRRRVRERFLRERDGSASRGSVLLHGVVILLVMHEEEEIRSSFFSKWVMEVWWNIGLVE